MSGTNAGFINIATKEGSNKYRGEAFYIGRPSAFTSPDAFGHSLDNTQNEFGGSIGGPIKKNCAFFYLGMEQDYLGIPFWTQFEPQAPGVTTPPALAALQQQVVGKSDSTAVFARTDILLNQNNTLNLQFDYRQRSAVSVHRKIHGVLNDPLATELGCPQLPKDLANHPQEHLSISGIESHPVNHPSGFIFGCG